MSLWWQRVTGALPPHPGLGMQQSKPISRVHPCMPGALEQQEKRWVSLYILHFPSSLQAAVTKRF